jgi:cellulose synthase/poly-beta-1,6-N-acetylglucosamine synthase-like glycosyltransferase/peptidoglycan/xylan/chitin deacetylase (PgdA/CDA1 family)
MVTRRRQREPRGHWLLVGLALLVLLGELCLNGLATQDASGVSAARTSPTVTPAERPGGGPVYRVAADGPVTSHAIPANAIALTFEDGPDPVWTPKSLEVLARHHAQATFFQLGSRVNQYPQISQQIVAAGSEVGSHGFTHNDLTTAGAWRRDLEVTLTSNAIAAATGRRPVLLRPARSPTPATITSVDLAAWRQASAAGYLTVLADQDTQDSRTPGVTAIVDAAWPAAGTGAVVSMHDSGGDRSQTVAALDLLIPRLQAAGYQFVTVSRALGLRGSPTAAVAQRWRGHGLRLAQVAGGWLANILILFMMITVIVGMLRLVVQVVGSWRHHRQSEIRRRGPMRSLGLVSVIVPAYNEGANIAAAVRSIVNSDYPEIEVIVVDDGSSDATADLVEGLGLPGVSVVRQSNAGKPAALNNGLRHARGDLLVFVDGDTVLEPETVSRLVQPLSEPGVGAVSGYPKVANRAGLLGRWQHLEYVVGFNLDRRMFAVARCMPTIPGAIGAFQRAALLDAGGVSAQTLAEDTDLTMTLTRSGWHVVYEPAAVAWTEAPATVRQLWRQRYRWSYGTLQVLWKHRHAVVERGPGGYLGRRCLPYLLLFQVVLPLLAPLVDVFGIYGMATQPVGTLAASWAAFTVIQMATTAYALRLDRDRYGPLWALPLQQILYRQLNYLVVVQAMVMALLGARLRWHRMHRTGAAAAYARAVRA